jgi:hypothetical protein
MVFFFVMFFGMLCLLLELVVGWLSMLGSTSVKGKAGYALDEDTNKERIERKKNFPLHREQKCGGRGP